MFLDALLLVSDAQAFTAAAVSTSSIDLGSVTPKRDIGPGQQMGFGIGVDVAASATTVKIEIISATDTALTAGILVLAERTFLSADLPAGQGVYLGFPENVILAGPGRYIGIRATPVGGAATVTLTIWLTAASMFGATPARIYAKGFTVS